MVAYLRIVPNPQFSQALTLGSAKPAHRFGCVSPGVSPKSLLCVWRKRVGRSELTVNRTKPRCRNLRYADLLDAADQDALAPGSASACWPRTWPTPTLPNSRHATSSH